MSEVARERNDGSRLPRILFLSHRFPYPTVGGDRVKSYHLLRHLSEIAEVDLIALDEVGTNSKEMPGIETLRSITVVPFSKANAALRILGSLLTPTPIEYAYYNSPEMQRSVNDALAKNTYDLVICFFLRTAQYVLEFNGCPKLLIAEDARVILQERASERFELSPEYLVRKIDAKKLRAYEPKIMASGFDLVTFVSNEDRQRILSANPAIPTDILSNGASLQDFKFYDGEKENEIVFVGHLGIYHNILMAEQLLKKIFPMIRAVSPSTVLSIVGKDPSERLRKLIGETPGATLHANVPDVSPHVQRARVFVHPQRVGTGIQNKLLEAMALGTPIVTTPIGAEGIKGMVDGLNVIIRTTDEEIAEATLVLLKESRKAQSIAAEARKLLETRYSWESVFTKLDRIITQLTSRVTVTVGREINVPTNV